jgi:hypothetical protein
MPKRKGSGTDWDEVLLPGQSMFDYLIGHDAMPPKDKEEWKIDRERTKRGIGPSFGGSGGGGDIEDALKPKGMQRKRVM